MKAVVFHGPGDIRLEEVPEPRIEEPTDAIVRITATAICGTDLHMIRGTMPGMEPGTILGHEAVGIVEQVGPEVRNVRPGDRVVVPSTISCGVCSYCRDGYTSQCDNANPNGHLAGTAFFGGPKMTGPFHGLQAEKARIPFANVGLVPIPKGVSDDAALMCSDIFPTGYYGAELANLHPGATVAVLGCGPVGQFAIASLKLMGAGRIFAIDCVPSRLETARDQGAEVIHFDAEDPVQAIRRLTSNIGVDRAIDAVGVDARHPRRGPAHQQAQRFAQRHQSELDEIAPQRNPQGPNWHPGDAPSLALEWAVEMLAKAGTLAILGVYPPTDRFFPIGKAMHKNITVRMGNCPHRKYIPHLLELVRTGQVDPTRILKRRQTMSDAIEAYKHFDRREEGWLKVELLPTVAAK